MPSSRNHHHHENHGLAGDLMSSAGNEAMLDMIVEANDGGEIPASCFVLGARSTVFQKMLFGESSHKARSRLKLDYGTNVVRTLVYYCRTNELDAVWHARKDETAARELVNLCECANAFELEGLQELVCETVFTLTKTHPHLACAVYDEAASQEGGSTVDALKAVALYVIRQNPEGSLLRRNDFGNREPGITSLSPAVVHDIVGDPRLCTNEITIFKAIMVWAKNMDALQEHRAVAKKMATTCIDLSKVAPSDLLGIVTDSGLVDSMAITNALTQLALRLEKEGVDVSRPRACSGAGVQDGMSQSKRSSRSHRFMVDEDDSVADSEHAGTSFLPPRPHPRKVSANRKLRHEQAPPTVTPERTQQDEFTEDSKPPPPVANPSARVESQPPRPPSPRRARSEPPKSFRHAVGLFLAEQVDTLCLQSNNYADDKENVWEAP